MDRSKVKFLTLLIALALLFYIGRYFPIDTQGIKDYLKRFPLIYSAIIFILLYVTVTFFIWLSKDVFKLISAVLFGAFYSSIFIWIAETINAFILFSLARYLGRDFVENSLKTKYKNLDERLGRLNFYWLFIFRGAPLIPFRFLDMGAGLTKIHFKKYITVVILASPLRILWVQYVLAGVGMSVVNRPAALVDYLMRNRLFFNLSLMYLALVIIVARQLRRKG